MKKAMALNSLAFVIDEECMIIIAISAVVMRPNHCQWSVSFGNSKQLWQTGDPNALQ